MGVAILAPVPADLLKSALETCALKGRVAFGTDAYDVFAKVHADYGSPLPVLIYPTVHYGDPDGMSRGGYACLLASYLKLTQADKFGRHPDPSIRPLVTIVGSTPDTAWQYFWEVEDLQHLATSQHVAVTTLTAIGKRTHLPMGYVPRGPIIVQGFSE